MSDGVMPAELKLLMVEDSTDDVELVVAELELAGLRVSATRVESAEQMRAALQAQAWSAVISDFNLPAFSTLEALEILHSLQLDLPFIIVSGCIGEETAVALMKAGAHDFVMKGNLTRLAPALQRELREASMREERRQAQLQLETSEKFLRAMTAALGDGILVQDSQSRLLFMNPEAERLLGWTEAELASRDVHDTIHYLHSGGGLHPKEACPILSVTSMGGVYRSYDDVFVRKGGEVFPVAYVVTAVVEQGEVVAAVTAFQDITARKQMEDELRESRRQLQSLSMFQQTAREEERKRIARELHDELGQALTALKIDLDWLKHRQLAEDRRAAEKLVAMEQVLGRTVDSVRRIAEDLRPGMLDDLGLAASIEWQVEQFRQRTGLACDLVMNCDEFDVADSVAICVFRIVQEALTNVARHSQAQHVGVNVCMENGDISLEVEDDGQGFLPGESKKRSFGLLGIRERVAMLGGMFGFQVRPEGEPALA